MSRTSAASSAFPEPGAGRAAGAFFRRREERDAEGIGGADGGRERGLGERGRQTQAIRERLLTQAKAGTLKDFPHAGRVASAPRRTHISPMARENTTQGISFTPELLDRAKARAKERGLSMSGYVQQLIRADLQGANEPLNGTALRQIKSYLGELVELRKAVGKGNGGKG